MSRRELAAQRLPDDIRAKGWRVSEHYDFERGPVMLTKWIFQHRETREYVRGEGLTDRDALNCVREAIKRIEART